MNYLKKNTTYVMIMGFLVLCLCLYFVNLGSYSFVDTDETRFVSIAKEMLNNSDWVNLKLNGENYFKYPPFLFVLVNSFCLIFGKISVETVRLPISLTCICGCLFLFLSLRKILTRFYAMLITLIFSTSLGMLVFSRLVTVDILFVIYTMSAILCSYRILLLRDEKHIGLLKIFVFLFLAMSTMTVGLLGFLVPFFTILTMHIFAGKLKDLFNFKNVFWGGILFLLIVLPWHFSMLAKHGLAFFTEYISVYNFFPYLKFKNIFVVLGLLILGFLPWSFTFLWIIAKRFKNILASFLLYFKDNSQEKLKYKWGKLRKIEKFLSLSTIVFFTSLVFSIFYGSKFTYLILFQIFPASCIAGYFWYRYIVKKEDETSMFLPIMIPSIAFVIASILGLFGHNFINTVVMNELKALIAPLVIIFLVLPIISIFSVLLNGRVQVFLSNLMLMFLLSFVLTPIVFNFIMLNKGEQDLIYFSTYANQEQIDIAAFIPSKKYSITYYYDKPVVFHKDSDFVWLENYMKENPENYIITEIKNLWEIEACDTLIKPKSHNIAYFLIASGKRYC